MINTNINIQLLDKSAELSRGSEYAAGWDVKASVDSPVVISSGYTVKIPTGFAIEIPTGCFGALFPRSGISTTRGLRLANCVGVIDSDYRGQVMVPIHNDTNEVQIVEPGERIAQLVILPYLQFKPNYVESLSSTARGSGGFGSTGT